MSRSPPDPRPPDAEPVRPNGLLLDTALQLLERAGHAWPPEAASDPHVWMQSLVDGLCTLSSRDPLTGLLNRRQFEAALEREADRAARSGDVAMLLLLDIDHFKRVNDRYGHAAGDEVIRRVAQALQVGVRPMDTVARIGGEEFAAVLPACPPAYGHAVAERVRRAIEALEIDLGLDQRLGVTISIGGSYAPQWVRSSCTLWLERADRQLYLAKHQGRNRVCLETPPESQVSAEERGLLLSPASDFLPDEPSSTS
ncbi:diguanylate cyclase (GGDEF)-like protein [Sphaerotilus hippei]|uniref:diguanylate cyclase n=1 Tax=Sphaerotilus hippei TaxID=744406 RepID=A0A318H0K7_9BURK|nr:GGDEF domain-containing protein [Sphaerotilus hippei]PXW96503.1 diguanylate cyclase (GGDEF)-like protein [Sphaerotilus hippei]